MEKILKSLPELMSSDDMEMLHSKIKNPDAFSIRSMSTKKALDFANVFDSFKQDDEIFELFEDFDNNDSIDKFVSALKESSDPKVLEVASFIENEFTKLENINLENKSLSSVVWAVVIYKYMTENRNHMGIDDIDDVFEKVPVSFIQSISNGDVTSEDQSVEQAREEVFSIFENTAIYDQLKGYFSTAFIKNKVWAGRDDFWFDNDKFEPIKPSSKSYDIKDAQSLLVALQVPTTAAYSQAIEYVAKNYCGDGKNDLNIEPKDLIDYKAHLIVSLLASNIVKEQQWDDFEVVEFNLVARTMAKKQKVAAAISKSHIAIDITNLNERKIVNIGNDAIETSLEILKEFGIEEDETIVEEELHDTDQSEEKTTKIKFGTKADYVKAYLNLFGLLVDKKLEQNIKQLKTTNDIKSRKSYSSENDLTLQAIAQECGAIENFVTAEEEKSNIQRLRTNAETTFKKLQEQYASLSQIKAVFAKVKSKTKANLDIQNVAFDYKFLRETSFITNEQHEQIIKEFYSFLAEDPILKHDQPTYRLASKNMLIINLKERIENKNAEYPFVFSALKLVTPSKKANAERIVDKLYVNEDGTLNDKFEALYNTITDSKASADMKKLAVLDAQAEGILSPEQVDQLFALLESKKTKKNNVPVADQLTIDFATADGENENE